VTESILDLQVLAPTDWRTLRDTRLRALRDSPHAFASRYDDELHWNERQWRRMFDDATWIVAREAGNVIGLARLVGEPAEFSARHAESIWVAPERRRRGVLRSLMQALVEIEHRRGITDIFLWVLEDNYEAQQVYETLGFRPTGERQFLHDYGQFERRLRLGTGSVPDA
jgi:ribosomal protein S18 acetylase RimI-like enzyme